MKSVTCTIAFTMMFAAGAAAAQRGARALGAAPPQTIECPRTVVLNPPVVQLGVQLASLPQPPTKVTQHVYWAGGPTLLYATATTSLACTYGYSGKIIPAGTAMYPEAVTTGTVLGFTIEYPLPAGKTCKASTTKPYAFDCR